MKQTLLLFLIYFSSTALSQDRPVREVPVPSSIDIAFSKFIEDPDLKNASVSFYVYDSKNGIAITEYNANMSLVTASTMKAITTATALEILGSYHVFRTKLSYDGYIDSNCTLHGNIYIEGGGDPTLGSRFYTKDGEDIADEWVRAIEDLGVHKIEGKIIGDDSYFSDEYVPATWGWGDMGNYYGSGVSGLSIYDNTVSYFFGAGSENNDSTIIQCYEPYTPDLTLDNRVKSGNTSTDEAYIYGGPYDPYRVLRGRIPKGSDNFEVKGAAHDPAYIAAFQLESKLWAAGISVRHSATTIRKLRISNQSNSLKRNEFYEHKSPSVSNIVYWTNLVSNNLFAEHLLKHIGEDVYHDGSVYSGTMAVTNYWTKKGLDMSGFYMNDGSGLSRANAISARQMVQILTYMKNQSKFFDSFYSSLPNCGKTGTLSSYGKGTKIYNNLRAKTGTMTRVKSYAGYVKSANGKELVFSIIVNNFNCTTGVVAKKVEKVLVSLGEYNQ